MGLFANLGIRKIGNQTRREVMSIMSMLEAPTVGKAKPEDNPKGYVLKAINEQRDKPTWVNTDKNQISVMPARRIFFPLQKGGKTVNQVIRGASQGADYTDRQQYHAFLDQLQKSVESGELDSVIDAWAKSRK